MRDPKRIDPLLKKLAKFWKQYPDLRLGQLLWSISKADPFYVEDHVLEQYFDENVVLGSKEEEHE